MDPTLAHALAEALGPFFGLLALGAIPASLVFITKHFKLRTRELELEAELHGKESQARLQATETRLAALEGALTSLVQAIGRREDLMQPPDAPQIAPEASRPASLAKVK